MMDWLIGIDPIKRCIVIMENDTKNPYQATGLIAVKKYHGKKIPKSMIRQYQTALESLYP